jgi:hypothetical protein
MTDRHARYREPFLAEAKPEPAPVGAMFSRSCADQMRSKRKSFHSIAIWRDKCTLVAAFEVARKFPLWIAEGCRLSAAEWDAVEAQLTPTRGVRFKATAPDFDST